MQALTLSRRRLALQRSYNRVLLSVVLVALGGFGLWRAIDPPHSTTTIEAIAGAPDVPAEAFARQFASAYLSYDVRNADARLQALTPFVSSSDEASVGFQLPRSGHRRVLSTTVAQATQTTEGERYVIAADTDADGTIYLEVNVDHARDGSLQLDGLPAVVGAPPITEMRDAPAAAEISDPDLRTIAQRALSNYLAGNSAQLQADLDATADVTLPSYPMRLQQLQTLAWSTDNTGLVATVQVSDRHGAQMTLVYRLDVIRRSRWFITRIATNPTAY